MKLTLLKAGSQKLIPLTPADAWFVRGEPPEPKVRGEPPFPNMSNSRKADLQNPHNTHSWT